MTTHSEMLWKMAAALLLWLSGACMGGVHGVRDFGALGGGQGSTFEGPYKGRPYMIRLVECKDVVVEDITLRNSPMWVQHYLACQDVHVREVIVKSHANHNNDGVVTGGNIYSGDDAIVLKSAADRLCTDAVVSGCVLRSACNALKMGTESNGGFQDIVMTGCAIYDTTLAGVALEIVDGSAMDRVAVSDIAMTSVGAPRFIRLGCRARPFEEGMEKPGVATLENITISDIEATGTDPAVFLKLQGATSRGVTLMGNTFGM